VEVAPAASARPAVINAVCDALEVDHTDMPLTPEAVWRAPRPPPRRPTWPGRDTTVRSANLKIFFYPERAVVLVPGRCDVSRVPGRSTAGPAELLDRFSRIYRAADAFGRYNPRRWAGVSIRQTPPLNEEEGGTGRDT
jgi:hypothetical protein